MSKRSRNRQAGRTRGPQPSPATRPSTSASGAAATPSGSASTTPPAPGRRPAPARPEPVARRTDTSVRRRDRGRATRGRSPVLPLALGGAAIVAAAILAIALSQSGGSPGASASAGSSVSTLPPTSGGGSGNGAQLPAFGDSSAQDPAIGQPIPEVSGTSFDGTPVSIERDGTPKLLLFLAHWCPHCQSEVPKIQQWVDQNGLPEGVDFISIATSIDSNRPNYPPDAWLARERWSVPVLVDADNKVANQYGLSAFPFWVAVSGDGTVAQRRTGAVPIEELAPVFDQLRATTAQPSGSAPDAGSPAPSPS